MEGSWDREPEQSPSREDEGGYSAGYCEADQLEGKADLILHMNVPVSVLSCPLHGGALRDEFILKVIM